jgi:CRP-like cAMP-binding protein
MNHDDQGGPAPRNHLLKALPSEDFARLGLKWRSVELVTGQTAVAAGEILNSVIFPEKGWFSMLITLRDGGAGEVGLVGREGMIGLPILLGDDRSHPECLVQCAGTAISLGVEAFREELDRSPALRARVNHWAMAYINQLAQTAVCNNRHHVEQRLARWLLMGHDRAEGDSFPMTHEFLSRMLGVRRAGVTVAAGALQRAGFIRYERGWIEIVDRAGLSDAACECYNDMRREYDRLMGPGTGR